MVERAPGVNDPSPRSPPPAARARGALPLDARRPKNRSFARGGDGLHGPTGARVCEQAQSCTKPFRGCVWKSGICEISMDCSRFTFYILANHPLPPQRQKIVHSSIIACDVEATSSGEYSERSLEPPHPRWSHLDLSLDLKTHRVSTSTTSKHQVFDVQPGGSLGRRFSRTNASRTIPEHGTLRAEEVG